MDLNVAEQLAHFLMRKHLGQNHDWNFKFDRAKCRFGQCVYSTKTISLSRILTERRPEEQVRNTILHEIAHICAPGDGHGRKWKRECRKIGAIPERLMDDPLEIKRDYPYHLVHGNIVVKSYASRPTSSFRILDRIYIVGRPETTGQLEILSAEQLETRLGNVKKGLGIMDFEDEIAKMDIAELEQLIEDCQSRIKELS